MRTVDAENFGLGSGTQDSRTEPSVRQTFASDWAERKPPRSSISALQWRLRCRAHVYRHGEKHVDSQRRKILLFKNKQKNKHF